MDSTYRLDDPDKLASGVALVQRELNEIASRAINALRSDACPHTVTPRPLRNSRRPSSRSWRKARSTVLELTPSTAARSLAGGMRSPGPASPSAIARRRWPATCSCNGAGLVGSTWISKMVIPTLSPYRGTGRPHWPRGRRISRPVTRQVHRLTPPPISASPQARLRTPMLGICRLLDFQRRPLRDLGWTPSRTSWGRCS